MSSKIKRAYHLLAEVQTLSAKEVVELNSLIKDSEVVNGVVKSSWKGYPPDTPLIHVAVQQNNLGVTKNLITAGANVNSHDGLGNFPIHFVYSLDVLKVLVEHGGIVDAVSDRGLTPLHVFVGLKNIEAVKYLLTKGARSDIPSTFQSRRGSTARENANLSSCLRKVFVEFDKTIGNGSQ